MDWDYDAAGNRYIQGSLFGPTENYGYVPTNPAPIRSMGRSLYSGSRYPDGSAFPIINQRQQSRLINYYNARAQREITDRFLRAPGGIQTSLTASRVQGTMVGAQYRAGFGAPNRIYSEGAYTSLSTGQVQGKVLGNQGNLFGSNFGYEGNIQTNYFTVRGAAYDNANRANSFNTRARAVLGGVDFDRFSLNDGAAAPKYAKFSNLRSTIYGEAGAFRANTPLTRTLGFLGTAGNVAGGLAYVGNVLNERSAGDIAAIGTGYVLSQGLITGGSFVRGAVGASGNRVVSGLRGAAGTVFGRTPFNIFSGFTAANSIGQTLGADPIRAYNSRYNSLLDATAFGLGVGGVPGAVVAGGLGLVSSGLLNPEGSLGSYQQALRLDAQTAAERANIYSPLGNNRAGLLSSQFNQQLNVPQKLAAVASLKLDTFLKGGEVTDAPIRLANVPSPYDADQAFNSLLQQAARGSGVFKGVGLQSRAAVLATELSQGSKTIPGLENFGDALYGRRGGISRGYQAIETALENGLRDSIKSQGLSYKQASLAENVGNYQIQSGLARAAGQRVTELNREIIKQRTQIQTPVVAPSSPRTISTLDFRTGKTYTHRREQTLGDAIAAGPIGQATNAVFGWVKSALGAGSISKLENQRGILSAQKQINETSAQERLTGVARQSPAAALRLATGGRFSMADVQRSGGGGGSSAYQQAAMARWARMDAEREARYRMMDQRAESRATLGYKREAVRGLIDEYSHVDLNPIDFNYRNVEANQGTYVYGVTRPADYLNNVRSAYQAELRGARDTLEQNRLSTLAVNEQLKAGESGIRKTFAPELASKDSVIRADALTKQTEALRLNTKAIERNNDNLEKQAKYVASKEQGAADYFNQQAQRIVAPTVQGAIGDIRFLQSQDRSYLRQANMREEYALQFQQKLGLVSGQRAIREDQRLRYEDAKTEYLDQKAIIAQKRFELSGIQKMLDERKEDGSFVYQGDDRRLLEERSQASEAALIQSESNANRVWSRQQDLFGSKGTYRLSRQQYANDFTKVFSPYFSAIYNGSLTGASPYSGLATATRNSLGSIFQSALGNVAASGITRLAGNFTPNGTGPQAVIETLAHVLTNKKSPWSSAQVNQGLAGIGIGNVASGYLYNSISQNYNNLGGQFSSLSLGTAGAILGQGLSSKYGGLVGGAAGALLGGAAGLTGTSPVMGALTSGLSGAIGGATLGGSILPGIGHVVGGVIGGIGGLLSGWLGGKRAKEQQQQQKLLLKQQSIQLAKGSFGLGPAIAGDLFDGYGKFEDDWGALNDYLGGGRATSIARDNGLKGEARDAFYRQYNQQVSYFKPLQNLAQQNKAVLSRPGGIEGALFDINVGENYRAIQSGAFTSGPVSQLTDTFQQLRGSLAQYGFDTRRSAEAQQYFKQTYQNQLQALDETLSTGNRDYGLLVRQQNLNASERGIQRDVLNRSVANFDRDSQREIEGALGTLQRRENRAQRVKELQEQQAFDKDILLRKQANFNTADQLQSDQDFAQRSDLIRNLDNTQQARTILVQGFTDMSARLTDATDEFYQLSNTLKEINRQMELLSRNLR